mmetsp:Transcript_132493/g.264410  ORF Transcript_132493/g.264410 Transcript_132493/m.264410 type:complete len:465 (+) Transcript_132493:144-1538(+)
MPVAFITVKLPDGGLVHLDVDLKTRVEDFRSILAPKTGVKRHRQRFVFSGRLLQDGRTLEAYGVERNSTIHLLHGGAEGGHGTDHDVTEMPPQLAALQRHVLDNPDIMQQMLEAPAMQSLLSDHDFLRSLLKLDPRLQQLLEGCPELQQMLYEEKFMQDATNALRNPVHVRDVLRSTKNAVAQLEHLGNSSFDVLRQMAEDVRRPMEEDGGDNTNTGPRKTQKVPQRPEVHLQQPSGTEEPEEEAEAGEDDDALAAEAVEVVPEPPDWLGTFDTNAMASMLQDQNLQQLLSQLVQALPGPSAKLHPDDPFLDASFIGQMFHSQTISSMMTLQSAVERLSLSAEDSPEAAATASLANKKAGTRRSAAAERAAAAAAAPAPAKNEVSRDSPAVLSGLHPKSPAADFKESFSLFVAAEQESPEIRYKGQLAAMGNMGFTDNEACIQALHSCEGNMTRAVEFLMAKQR